MRNVEDYFKQILGIELKCKQVAKESLNKLPYVYTNKYNFYETNYFEDKYLLMKVNKEDVYEATQLRKQVIAIQQALDKKIIVVLDDISAVTRKRLIEQRINFIVPGKQMYLAEMYVDIREFKKAKSFDKSFSLLPSAQLILLYHILHKDDNISNYSFKELAEKTGYSQMAITKAINNLKNLLLANVVGTKEKRIELEKDIPKLWKEIESKLVNPVLKTVYVDEKPEGLYKCNVTALEEYSNMNPENKEHYAIEKNQFYELEKNNKLFNLNEENGFYALEVWKYNPKLLADGISKKDNVDPLSLYLSLKDKFTDERIDMALDQIIEKYIW